MLGSKMRAYQTNSHGWYQREKGTSEESVGDFGQVKVPNIGFQCMRGQKEGFQTTKKALAEISTRAERDFLLALTQLSLVRLHLCRAVTERPTPFR